MPKIVIVGAGIIGISTAYFLSHSETLKDDSTITIIDQCAPASGASGKAGAFIARNWSGGSTSSLAGLSFRLHDELAEKYHGAERWGYWRCKALSVVGRNSRGATLGDLTRSVRLKNVTARGKSEDLGWVKPGVVHGQSLLGDEDSIAVCDPYLFSTSLLDEAIQKGAKFLQVTAMSLSIENNHVKGIHVADASGKTLSLPCDVLVIAAGPWTGSLSKRLGLPTPIPVFSYAGHSLLVRPSAPVTKECLFMTLATPTSSYHPEIFPRRSGEVYIGGINEDLGLPEDPVAATPQKSEIRKLVEIADTLFAEYTIEKEQLCFRPMTEHGDPFVCPVPEVEGVFVGAGHSFWGLTLGPGTGKVLSEMVLGEELSADVSPMLSLDEVEE